MIKGLDDHLTESLGRPHNVRRVNSFVCTDEDKTFTAINQSCVSCFICTDGIVLDCLARAVLHQRYMLVGRRVVYDFRAVCLEDFKHQPAVTDRTDPDGEIEFWVFLL